MKKRQQDFQKLKLRVGKHLPKGRNETRTSFKTRKIHLREQIKESAKKPTLKELLSFMKTTDVKIKFDNLRKLSKYVSDNKDSLSMIFPDLLKELGRNLQESDPKIRSEVISVIGESAKILTDTQLKSFISPLTSYINCMTTHIVFQVRQDSLKFLDVLLKSHCNVICQSYEILFFLLNMISCEDKSASKECKNKMGRKLLDIITSKISADQWRMEVLERMLTFLHGILLEKTDMATDIDDQKEVYWNAKEVLYLPLYLNSGTEPAKFDYSQLSLVNLEGSNSKYLQKFMNELICVLSAILKSILTHKSFSESNIKYLSIITQIVCCLGELAIKDVDLCHDLNAVQGLLPISNLLMKFFPYSQQTAITHGDEVECVQLNLGMCYFYCLCSFLSKNAEESYFYFWDTVKEYVDKVFYNSGVRLSEKSISLSLKISKILIKCKNFSDSARDGILMGLLTILETKKFTPETKNIYSFFMDLSLDYDYSSIHKSQAMRRWFNRLIENLNFMVKSKNIIPNYLNYIKQVCARRNFFFMEALNLLPPEKFIDFLKCDDEDVQCTIIHLIVSLDKIPPDFLQTLAETIRDESFSMKIASRLIRLLNCRFSKPDVPYLEQLNFVKFLLNLGCDTFLISDPSLDSDPLPLKEFLINIQQSFDCHCEIYPTCNFERHRELFEVCAECLSSYRKEIHMKCIHIFIGTIFSEYVRYPVHSAVAIIELFKRFTFLLRDRNTVPFLQNFVYSCLLYNSLMTNEASEDLWTEYLVPAVDDCINIIEPMEVIAYMDSTLHSFKEDHLHHALRILLFLMQRRSLNMECAFTKNCLDLFINKLTKLDAFPKRQIFRFMVDTLCEYTSCI